MMSVQAGLLSEPTLGIIYSVIARGTVMLTSYASCHGNFTEVVAQVLDNIPSESNGKLTYAAGDYMYHYICEDRIIYMCITDDDFERSKAFLFLDDIKRRFQEAYRSSVHTAEPHTINKEFSRKLAQEMVCFNIQQLCSESMSAARMNYSRLYTETSMSLLDMDGQIRLENIGIRDLELTGSGDLEQLELMESVTESLRSYDSYKDIFFHQSSKVTQCCRQHARTIIIILAILTLILVIVTAISFGVCLDKKCGLKS